jgi:ligand-binding SRPBCC domain-containing protein
LKERAKYESDAKNESMYFQLTDRFVVAADAERTWEFFSSAENLPRITPPWLRFTVQTPGPILLQNDSLIEYTIRWMGLPIHWRTRIIDWQPTRQFIDLQIRGPYRLWHHQHTFAPVPDGTECSDRVIYALPFAPLDRLAHALTVRRQLLSIFRFRREVIARELGWTRGVQQDVEISVL